MIKGLRNLLFVTLLSQQLCAQVLPSDNTVLNYRITGFSITENTKAAAYLFQIARGNLGEEKQFVSKLIIKQKSTKARSLITLPAFGTSYTWRVCYLDKTGKEINKSELHHFATGMIPAADTGLNGLFVSTKAAHHKDMLLLVDGILVIYDMEGSPVWYMPEKPDLYKRNIELRDFKPTTDGTFTFLNTTGAYEVDYNGRLLWSAPNDGKVSKDKTEYYHHELTKLSNGHYMVAGAEIIERTIPASPDVFFQPGDTTVIKKEDGRYYKKIVCGTLIEYDAQGNVAWTWKSSEHFEDKDYFRPMKALKLPFDSKTYMNGFEFDEQNNVIYVSFKNINRIVKIKYPSGKVINSFGEEINTDLSIQPNSPFYGQHSCRVDRKTNNLYLYNNNCNDFEEFSGSNMDERGKIISHVSIYRQPANDIGALEKIWDFPCELSGQAGKPVVSTKGGSVSLLEDNCMLINMGTLNHMMIINKDKKLVWDASPYITDATGSKMAMVPYRCNHITKSDIERFVFREIAAH